MRPRLSTLAAFPRDALTPSRRTNSFFTSRSLGPSETPCGSPPVDALDPRTPRRSARFTRTFISYFVFVRLC